MNKFLVAALLVFATCFAQAQTYIQGPALIQVPRSVVTAGTTTTLTNADQTNQRFTGTLTQTAVLPSATTMPKGRAFYVMNRSTGTVTVNANGGGLIKAIPGNSEALFILMDNSTAAGVWDSSGGTVILGVGAIDSQTPAANGATAAANFLYLQSASATVPGLVNNTTQTMSGNKTFSGTIAASNLSGTNTGDVTLAAFGSTPANEGASLSGQILTLQPADATHGGGMSITTQTLAGAKTFSGVGSFPSGAVGAVGLHLSTDVGTGFWRPGVDQLNISAAGATVANIGTSGVAVTGALSASTTVTATTQLISSVATGTAPLVVSSTTQVANLNAATAGSATTATTATNATNVATTQVSTNASYFPLMVSSSTNGNQAADLGTGLTFNPSTNNLSTTTFTGALVGNASTVTTNANLTGDVTSSGNATTIGANKVTNSMLAQAAAFAIKGNNTNATANIADLSPSQWVAMMPERRLQSFLSGTPTMNLEYAFFVASNNVTTAATYTNNSITYTVTKTVASGNIIYLTGSGPPLTSGTLTKATGTGDSSIAFSSFMAPIRLILEGVGGGGGGQGGGDAVGGTGGNGGNTTFASTIVVAPGASAASGGTGGSIGGGAQGYVYSGGDAQGGDSYGAANGHATGAQGVCTPFGGAGRGAVGTAGSNAVANTGSGGGGGGANSASAGVSGAGGAAGAFARATLANTASGWANTFAIAIGGGGNGGTLGANGFAGGNGAAGALYVWQEYY